MRQLPKLFLSCILFCYIFAQNEEEEIQVKKEFVGSDDNDTNITITTEEESITEEIDLSWLPDAIKDVAYYLRSHKFNEYDRRYNKEKPKTDGEYYASFPKPPLRSLHWEVQLHCEVSFIHCMEHLNKKVTSTNLRRKDDTSVVIVEQNWTLTNNSLQINTVDKECLAMKTKDDTRADPFEGPLERYRWRTTASYYMCWFAMNEVPELEHLGERCDNFANCLDQNFGPENNDPRASDNISFSCILYSVCPDPCCPFYHISSFTECWNNKQNPCYLHNTQEPQCLFERNRNRDFTDIVLNRWNVTCECPYLGFIWNSKFGTCVDVNECLLGNHNCDEDTEVCVNSPGSYKCVCNWGYVWNKLDQCEESEATIQLKKQLEEKPEKNVTGKLSIKILFKKLFKSPSNVVQFYKLNLLLCLTFYLFQFT